VDWKIEVVGSRKEGVGMREEKGGGIRVSVSCQRKGGVRRVQVGGRR
jgi:hypothetical protein